MDNKLFENLSKVNEQTEDEVENFASSLAGQAIDFVKKLNIPADERADMLNSIQSEIEFTLSNQVDAWISRKFSW